ncbi:hypothetical protein Gpo141_00009687 [Globisporangium polare]
MASDDIRQLVGRFVWEKWRSVWYMGRIVEASRDGDGSHEPRGSAVRVHVHGERDTNDKWLSLASASLELVVVISSEATAIGEFPAPGDHVELLLMDEKLHDLLDSSGIEDQEQVLSLSLTLVGRVVQVLPAHDASVVDVVYPPAYHSIVQERRVHIGNGYLKVVPESESHGRQQRLEAAITVAYAGKTEANS